MTAETVVDDPLVRIVRRHISSAITAVNHADPADKWNLTVERAEALLAAIAETGRLLPEGTWAIPPEPGPDVAAVRCDCHARIWRRLDHSLGSQWTANAYPWEVYPWRGLLANHPKLFAATEEAAS